MWRDPSSLAVLRAHFSHVGDEVSLLPKVADQFCELLDKLTRQKLIDIVLYRQIELVQTTPSAYKTARDILGDTGDHSFD